MNIQPSELQVSLAVRRQQAKDNRPDSAYTQAIVKHFGELPLSFMMQENAEAYEYLKRCADNRLLDFSTYASTACCIEKMYQSGYKSEANKAADCATFLLAPLHSYDAWIDEFNSTNQADERSRQGDGSSRQNDAESRKRYKSLNYKALNRCSLNLDGTDGQLRRMFSLPSMSVGDFCDACEKLVPTLSMKQATTLARRIARRISRRGEDEGLLNILSSAWTDPPDLILRPVFITPFAFLHQQAYERGKHMSSATVREESI